MRMPMDHCLIFFGIAGDVTWLNAAALKLFRRDDADADLRGSELLTVCAPIADADFEGAVRAVKSGALESSSGECRVTFPDRESKFVTWTISRAEASGLSPNFIVCLTQGDNQRCPVTSAKTPAFYRDFFDNASEGFFRCTLDGRFVEVNVSLAQTFGYQSPDELLAATRNSQREFYRDGTRHAEFLTEVIRRGRVMNFESEIIRGDNSTGWILESLRTIFADDGTAAWIEGTALDISKTKEAAHVMRTAEERFRRLLEVTLVVPWEADADTWNFSYVGPQAVNIFGYSHQRWLDENFWIEHVHPEDRAWLRTARLGAIEKEKSLKSEYRMISADNRTLWVREIMNVTKSESGKRMLVGFMSDITVRQEEAQSLRESQLLLQQIASASPVLLYVYDLSNCKCMSIRGRAEKILGYSEDALKTMDPLFTFVLAHPEETSTHLEYREQLIDARESDIYERDYRLRAANGEWLWIRSRETLFKRDENGRPQQIVGAAEDITRHRHAREQLEESEALFRKLAETTKVIPFEANPTTWRFSYVGPQAEQLLNRPLSDWYRQDFLPSVMHPDDLSLLRTWTSDIQASQQRDLEAEFRVSSASGEYLWLRQIVHSAPEEKERKYIRGFLIDVTEAKKHEQERERSRAEFRELAARSTLAREEERTALARELHDELGQALTALRFDLNWTIKTVARRDPPPDFRSVEDKLADMEALIEEALGTVRNVTSALRPPLLDEIGLPAAIEWHATDFARRTGVECEVSVSMPLSPDPDVAIALFRICQEALTNVTRHAAARHVRVSLNCAESVITLAVRDDGRGISPEVLATPNRFGLLGMRERAWAVGGQLEIKSSREEGTVVSVHVPVG